MSIDHMPDHLCNELVDENNANVVTAQETPGGREGGEVRATCPWAWLPPPVELLEDGTVV